VRLVGVFLVLLLVDVAAFVGWGEAIAQRIQADALSHTQGVWKDSSRSSRLVRQGWLSTLTDRDPTPS
jgi:hypothetical protein